MIIHCSKKLLDILPKSVKDNFIPNSECPPPTLYDWEGSVIRFGRYRALVFINCITRYTIFLYRPMAKDLESLPDLLEYAIGEIMQSDCFTPEVINRYTGNLGEASYSGTSGKKQAGQLSMTCETAVQFYNHLLDPKMMIQYALSDNANNCPGRIRTKKYEFPLLVMQEKMDELMISRFPFIESEIKKKYRFSRM